DQEGRFTTESQSIAARHDATDVNHESTKARKRENAKKRKNLNRIGRSSPSRIHSVLLSCFRTFVIPVSPVMPRAMLCASAAKPPVPFHGWYIFMKYSSVEAPDRVASAPSRPMASVSLTFIPSARNRTDPSQNTTVAPPLWNEYTSLLLEQLS